MGEGAGGVIVRGGRGATGRGREATGGGGGEPQGGGQGTMPGRELDRRVGEAAGLARLCGR